MLSPHPSFGPRRGGADAQSVYLFEKYCTQSHEEECDYRAFRPFLLNTSDHFEESSLKRINSVSTTSLCVRMVGCHLAAAQSVRIHRIMSATPPFWLSPNAAPPDQTPVTPIARL
ncbi:hypothetical protein Y032_0541g3195 [Ancylostoma ceylanicum]|uniref:Uncharacterized protein n=1 Tax=Ancylostoma ceylanicum TaxID=53326 RepID=A0A016WRD3_9BILA|nr:hypothetical protein Y032_0541g3195 [Ancylostoma ceylanicum]